MKKRSIRTGILFALLTPVLLICAENPIYAATTQTAGSATVSYHVDPAYQVTIPVDTSMQFNETETSYGNIVVEPVSYTHLGRRGRLGGNLQASAGRPAFPCASDH